MRNPINNLQPAADKAAISLSLLCAAHCLALPLLIALLPSLTALGLADEAFHKWVVIAVIPLSAFALTLGCNKHRQMGVLYIGLLGLILLCATALLGHEILGEHGEKMLTLTGASLIALSHIRNYRLCQKGRSCECID